MIIFMSNRSEIINTNNIGLWVTGYVYFSKENFNPSWQRVYLLTDKIEQAQLLARDVENGLGGEGGSQDNNNGDTRTKDDELRKMVTDIFIDNATLRMQVNSVIRCTLNTADESEQDEEEEEEEAPLRKTVLSKFLER